jgi:integrase
VGQIVGKRKPLTAKEWETLGLGKHADGRGLYLIVRPSGRTAAFIFTSPSGKRREMHLGPADKLTLQQARGLADAARLKLLSGVDPLEARDEAKRKAQEAAAAVKRSKKAQQDTLRRVCRGYHERAIEGTVRNAKHGKQWISTLETHVFPTFGDRPVASITPIEFLDLLRPLYATLPETARRVKQRLDTVYEDAVLRGTATSNPIATLRRALRQKRTKTKHRAIAYAELPALLERVRVAEGSSARALEFTALTAARTGEVIGMTWDELNRARDTWTVPKERMKAVEPHTVYLSERAREILKVQRGLHDVFVFPSPMKDDKPLSNMAMLTLLRRLKVEGETTVHGLRAAFSTWANENNFNRDAIEACLAHQEEDRVRAAYNRGEFKAERQRILTAWAAFLGTP